MKNATTVKSSKTDSPKTPGGISKSLLTPCRRLGLSRNIRRSGSSPFQSPLSCKPEVKQEKVETRKRKEALEEIPQTPDDDCGTLEVVQTPTRNVEPPRRKKSKTLLSALCKPPEENAPQKESVTELNENKGTDDVPCKVDSKDKQSMIDKEVTTPMRKSKSRSKKNTTLSKSISKEATTNSEKENLDNSTISITKATENTVTHEATKESSPNDLTKTCIVLIQKKIFKKELIEKHKSNVSKETLSPSELKEPVSQAVFDSDSDDVPLISIANKGTEVPVGSNLNQEDEDFVVTKPKIGKLVKTKFKSKVTSPVSTKTQNNPIVTTKAEIHKLPNSQNSDDEDDFETKRTILIRRSYNKIVKPQKAKSTGSITQKDIDDMKARIETKKKMLLARAMKDDTKELRDLVKKWQKGCQEALMELMDLMKAKFPDKQNMDYSEILETLKIPASIVGYDSENDCFLTPNDENIILAKV